MSNVSTCQEIYAFLGAVRTQNVASATPPGDLALLQQLGLAQVVAGDQYGRLKSELDALPAAQAALAAEENDRARRASQLQAEDRSMHSILFRFESGAKRAAAAGQEASDRAGLAAESADLTTKEKAVADLLARRAVFDGLTPFGTGFIGLTSLGQLHLRDLGVRLYRLGDQPFSAYWSEMQATGTEMNAVADASARIAGPLAQQLPGVDRSYLWSIALGLAKQGPDPGPLTASFLANYAGVERLAGNPENRTMAAEILTATARPIAENLPLLTDLESAVRKAGVPRASSLGVAALLLLGRRADGTFATGALPTFLQATRSYEAAALLAIWNRPADELLVKFAGLRQLFLSWGYGVSEDVELSSAYLTVSELAANDVATKLAILANGLRAYLAYPLVAAALLAAIPRYEANETLNLLEAGYEVIGRRAMPATQSELICLAVRLIHEVQSEKVAQLDATQAPAAAAPGARGYYAGPRFFYAPLIIAHGGYYSTFGGIAGVHPGHAHGLGGFSG
jgi:hypothetical protein